MLKTLSSDLQALYAAYHLGEGRVLKTQDIHPFERLKAYHLGEGRVLKT